MTTEKPSPTRDEFLRDLAASGLAPPPDDPAADGKTLADHLVAAGTLTRFQADTLLDGRPGDLRVGNYDVLDKLGAGGMGAVFKARHRRMKRIVALKVLIKALAEAESFVQRFQREVEVVARLAHPNVVMAYDADESEAGPFLVMEFVDGKDLATEVNVLGPLSVADAVECTLQAARGLAYAHAQGIIHRDVKPANLLRAADGTVKVADLGLARLSVEAGGSQATASSLTQAGGIVGTLDYMSPEQALDSTAVDARVDVYSLGCTLYFLMAGKPPYFGSTLMAILLQHREAPIPVLRTAPPALEALFRRMVAKDPAHRPTMADAAHALEDLKRTGLSTARPTRFAGGPARAADPSGATAEFDSSVATAARAASQGMSAAGPAPASPSAIGRAAGLTVVVVEPSRMQAGITRRFLQQLGVAAVHTAASGTEAVEAIRREKANVVVCSMQLADMTGVELSKALAADPALSGVGFVLARSADDGSATDLPTTGRAVLLPKPFDLTGLSHALAKASGRAG